MTVRLHLPSGLREAIAGGWSGLTIVEHAEGATLVLSASAAALAARRDLQLTMTLEPADRPRLLRITVGTEPGGAGPPACACASLDLAYPEGRALLERVAGQGILWVVLAETGTAAVAGAEHVHVDASAGFLRRAAALAGEWHPVPEGPPELAVDEWRDAVGRAPCLAAAAAGGPVVLVVPRGALARLERDGVDAVVRLVLAACGERALIARLAEQPDVVVLAAGHRPSAPPSARMVLAIAPAAATRLRPGPG